MKNPRISSRGDQFWLNYNGQYHREDGPAVIWANGTKTWWINSNPCYNNKSFQKAANLSDEDMLMIKLKYGDVK